MTTTAVGAINPNERCKRCALTYYEHRDHHHRRIGCAFGDCGEFV